jgi:(1->4)-alpha-D-glucan 1-alpha-D-glucosylmutase
MIPNAPFPSVPRSTYRLQLHAGFNFDDAAAVTDYLHELGVSHVYCSPYLQASSGSLHGYDVVNSHQVNKELGGEPGRARFHARLKELGMGQVLDIVPNHMAITGSENAWWWDTLENGPASRYAPYFDIEWNAPEERLRNKILLPVLEDHSGRVIEAKKLALARDGGSFVLRYYDHAFPVAPESMAALLSEVAGERGSQELWFLADALTRLAIPAESGWSSLMAHHRDKESIKALLARVCEEHPDVAKEIDAAIAKVNDDADALDALLLRQNYRLSRWRSAARELGYRRFFDINTLVGIRVEDELVFADSHELILQWMRCDQVDGVRVDHPDGLRDPAGYFQRLRTASPATWIIAEKILQPGEKLPDSWEIAGTTGYDFLNVAGGLFVDPRAEAPLNELYRNFTGESLDFSAVAHEKKLLVLRDILGSDINRLTALLLQICEERRNYRDYTRHELHEAIRELAASFPVYRTYVQADAARISDADAAIIAEAVESARAARADLDPRLFDLLRDILTLEVRGAAETEWVMRFQQTTAATAAKGVEDTAFYSFLRLVSLNEVGGDPRRFGTSIEEFHKWCAETQARHPATMLTTSTHDTKRSEDARIRIGALTEIPAAWAEAVVRWNAMNAQYRTDDLPDRKTEYLLYQTLVGAWPISVDRLNEYMRKAVREAKEKTSWVEPNAEFEEALDAFVRGILADGAFVADFESFLGPLLGPARTASLSLELLKLTAPGIPDLYQGSELWDLSLVDPDNRRPVDYESRRRMLRELDRLNVDQIVARGEDGLPKLFIVQRALRLRNVLEDFGEYRPLWASGPKASNLVAFERGGDVVVAAPRLATSAGNWEDTHLELPEGRWSNQFTGEEFDGGRAEVGRLLARFPVMLLARVA